MHSKINIKGKGLFILLGLFITYLFLSFVLYSATRQYFWSNFYENLSLSDFHTRFNIERNEDRLIIITQGILFLVFISGFYNTVIAFLRSKAIIISFVNGFKRYASRVLIIGLLIYLMIAFVSVLSYIIYMVVQIIIWNSSIYISASAEDLVSLLYYTIMFSLFYPLVIFWFPCLFADNVGVFESLERSIKKGIENYWLFFLLGISYTLYRLVYYYIAFSGAIPVTSSIFDIVWVYSRMIYPFYQMFIVVMQFFTVFLAFILYERKKSINIRLRNVLRALKSY